MSQPAERGQRRIRIQVDGIVQGVGFRPTVYQLARSLDLVGWVRNDSEGVEIEVAGPSDRVQAFVSRLPQEAPPLAKIVRLEVKERPWEPGDGFHIQASERTGSRTTLISPDVSICEDCRRELLDPSDRRFRYPFINCTNCGPRYTIIRDVPYDRDNTTMDCFPMCAACRAEYEDPRNRRFHAQPNACWQCGPLVWLEDAQGHRLAEKDEAVRQAIRWLAEGKIVAVKGLGGFHLAVLATDEAAVARLRRRKIREEKPFAVMFASREAVQGVCQVHPEEEALLLSRERPIVLLAKRRAVRPGHSEIAPSVAPRNRFLGAFLPYTPLHALLFHDAPYEALVMTSGNQSDEPIVTDNAAARDRLRNIADVFLLHNRDIHIRCDDSVVRSVRGKPRPLRRARGYVPVPVVLRESGPVVLGVGGELKNTVCLTRGRYAFVSQHVGDLENLETLRAFEHTIDHLQKILEVHPRLIVHDLHPDYLSTQWAEGQTQPARLAVQHHHAHIASVVAENGWDGPVLGVALDGTGYGPDGTIWGGEFLLVDGARYERLGRFSHLPLPGGERAIKEPWRMALAALWCLEGEEAEKVHGEILSRWPEKERRVVFQMLRSGFNSPLSSSCGRLFDAVSALAGIRDRITYEGQAAIELEQALEPDAGAYEARITRDEGLWVLDVFPLLEEVARDVRRGTRPGIVSARFHNGLVRAIVHLVERLRQETGLSAVALSGGVFQNIYLSRRLEEDLIDQGFQVLIHEQVPPNDACISLGQAHVGREHLKR
ncbi:Hydrogenase maturation protein, carbamoyltransferase HypF [Desulfacinum hydrothermale DSM 13146]|uniref:Carbamoyltransferase n=1 Tax=Desulfacinum hydrothermale DSM 13146 TaxID=1121390 RepID=A0A1W1XBD6_9BACT|nr:carbamoyltransferase HypF [Desulfacinum hydrothermale]SMC21232.1 Hydrogenase maturation protein, carbamoyltransferase HypF [Desulfacinum hydrothermale DSM 13146]